MTKVAVLILLLILFAGNVQSQSFEKVDQLMLRGDYAAALDIVETAIDEGETNPKAFYKAGLIYQNLLQHGKALEYLQNAVQESPENLDYQYSLGRSFYQLDKYEDAMRAMEKVFTADSTHISAGTYLGMTYMKLNELQSADKVHLVLVSRYPKNAHAYKQLGISAYKQGKDSTSIANTSKYFAKFDVFSPEYDPDVLYYIGKNDLRSGNIVSAEYTFRTGSRKFPHLKIFHSERAKILYGQQQYEEAIEPFERLIAMGDSTAAIFQHLGFCYYYVENMVRSRNAFRKSFEKDPSNGLTAFYLGITERETGNLQKALDIFEQAEKLSFATYLGQLYTQMATAYQKAGEPLKSVRAYEQAMKYNQNSRNFLFHIATLYDDEVQNHDKALEYYQKFLEHSGATKPENKSYAQERVTKLKTEKFLKN